MRKHYLDNIRWMTVVTVVIYHVIYMYNAEGIAGVLGKITNLDVQYYDLFQYMVYPWIMMLLFMVSGICARLYLNGHRHRDFIRYRTTKLLVPSTIGLFAFQFLQGYVNASLSGVFERQEMPLAGRIVAVILSGTGVLWYIQLLWLFSMLLVLVHRFEKDRLWRVCKGAGLPVLILLWLPVFGASQILNMPKIVCYRFGLYFCVFLLGDFVFSHDEVVGVLQRWFPLLASAAAMLGIAFCMRYFGENYADKPVYQSALYIAYGYFACLAILGGMAKYGNIRNRFTQWMCERSFGLYVFHYLGISSVALFIAKRRILPAPAVYAISLIAGFAGGYLLNAIVSRIPGYRWAVLGIRRNRANRDTTLPEAGND